VSARERFAATTIDLVEDDPSVALVYAEISAGLFEAAEAAYPDRVVNVGIREQLMVNVGAGYALTGMRPVVHTIGSFLVERAFEQIKLGFVHQGVGGVLVGYGGSFDRSAAGRTHQSPADVALLDTLPDVRIHAPSTVAEVDAVLRDAVAGDGLHFVRLVEQANAQTHLEPGFHVLQRGSSATVVALGPVLDDVLAATAGRDVTVLYAHSVRPFDAATLRAAVGRAATADVLLVEPWLVGTSSHEVSGALSDLPHRVVPLGSRRTELRHYGTPQEHIAAHGMDAVGIRGTLDWVLRTGGRPPGVTVPPAHLG
jgi:transketolase